MTDNKIFEAMQLIEAEYQKLAQVGRLDIVSINTVFYVTVYVNVPQNHELFNELNAVRVRLEDSLPEFRLNIEYRREEQE